MTTGRINQINNYVNDKKTVVSPTLRSLVTLAYLVSLIIKNNINVYSNKADLYTISTKTTKPVKDPNDLWKETRKIRKNWNP